MKKDPFHQLAIGFGNKQSIHNHNITYNFDGTKETLVKLLSYTNTPTVLNTLVLSLYEIMEKEHTQSQYRKDLHPDILAKLDFNNVIQYRQFIEKKYVEEGGFLESAYEALDYDKPGKKKQFLSYLNDQYLIIKGGILKENSDIDKMKAVKNNSDRIITEMIDIFVQKFNHTESGLEIEAIESGIAVVICHGIVDCKVLENPNAQT